MESYNRIHTWSVIKTFFVNVFSSRYFIFVLDLIMTTLISIHTSKIDMKSTIWKQKLIIYIILSITLNFICIFMGHIKQRKDSTIGYINKAYDIQNRVNCYTANNLYRVNKKISKSIRDKKLEKGAINSIVDFQSLSFEVCNELYNFLVENFNCGDCEITIFQRFTDAKNKDFVKMIAYKNTRNSVPSSYGIEFKLSHKSTTDIPVFVEVFNDLNADIKILHKKKKVQEEFKYFDHSKNRENRICQYIGIPIKTNRNKIEIMLQIDVSRPRALGWSYNALKQFSEYIILPFCNMLYCSYERDLIFNKFYDILDENIEMGRQ